MEAHKIVLSETFKEVGTKTGGSMSKFVLPLAAVGTSALLWAAPALATGGITAVSGVVTGPGNAPLDNANVTVTCNSHTGTDTTDNTGTYEVDFTSADCPKGSLVNVTAVKGSLSGTNSGTADKVTNKLNVATVNVQAVPELGVLGGSVAGLGGIGAFMVARRRAKKN
jgi:hypothetical protein